MCSKDSREQTGNKKSDTRYKAQAAQVYANRLERAKAEFDKFDEDTRRMVIEAGNTENMTDNGIIKIDSLEREGDARDVLRPFFEVERLKGMNQEQPDRGLNIGRFVG